MTLLVTMTDQRRCEFRLLPRGIEENRFKAVPEGWLVTIKRPFGSDWNHVVSDVQKPTIAKRLRLAVAARYALLVCWMLIVMMNTSSHPEVSLLCFGLLLAMNACDYLSTRYFLRDLPPTSETATFREQMRSRAGAMSVRAIVTLMVICTIILIGVVVAGLITDKVSIRSVSLMLVCALWLGAAIYWLRLLVIKLSALRREPRPSASLPAIGT